MKACRLLQILPRHEQLQLGVVLPEGDGIQDAPRLPGQAADACLLQKLLHRLAPRGDHGGQITEVAASLGARSDVLPQ